MIRSVFTFFRHTIPGKTYHIQLMLMKTKTRGIMLRQTGSIASQLNLTTLGDRQLHCKVEPPPPSVLSRPLSIGQEMNTE